MSMDRASVIPPPLRGDPLPAEGDEACLPLRLRRGIEGDGFLLFPSPESRVLDPRFK
ncbi:MAG: hypothetical protein OJF61_002164 [Rhodanobacteraceae bacterium]|jgi:hypothetical protein|nr:MAG: hypothetical protein OJF61_002164 [Rhodanobacteraceae bacterium]